MDRPTAPAPRRVVGIGHLVRRLQQHHTALWATEDTAGLTGPQYALVSAADAEPAIGQRRAGVVSALGPSTAAEIVARLMRDGWLARVSDTRDARRYLLSLTPPARAALPSVTAAASAVQGRLLARLPAPDAEWFLDALARVAYAGAVPSGPATATAVPLTRSLEHLIRRTERRHGVHWARRIGRALTPAQYSLLRALDGRTPSTQSDAAALASVDPASAVGIVARLVTAGLVAQTPDTADRRRKLLLLTPSAEDTLARTTPEVFRLNDDLTAVLRPREAPRFVELLRRLAYR